MSLRTLRRVGIATYIAGGCLIIASLWFTVGSPTASLVKGFLLIIGAALFGSGLCVRFHQFITPKLLRILDLVWISASAIALSLAVSRFYSVQYTIGRAYLYANLKDAQESAAKSLSQFQAHCADNHFTAALACGWAFRMANEIKENKLSPEEVNEVCSKPISPENPKFSLCLPLNYISTIQREEIDPDTSSSRLLERLRFLLQCGIVIAIAARFPKSVYEVFLLDKAPRVQKLLSIQRKRRLQGR